MKKFIAYSCVLIPTIVLVALPLSNTFAALPTPSLMESIPSNAKYEPPCERSDIRIGDTCVDRRYGGLFRTNAMLRRQERLKTREIETRRTQSEEVRSFYLHPTGVRASQMNGFELLEPNSRQFKRSETQVEFNLRALRARQTRMGAARSRIDNTPRAHTTTRTKRNNFWDPTNMRVRRGLRL